MGGLSEAPPLNAEFNQVASAFDGSTGHEHTGAAGDAPKIDLTTSVDGYLPQNNGGTGGKNNLSATSNPTVGDDAADGYVPGSLWENTTTGRLFVCVGNTTGAAVWREVALYTSNALTPATNDAFDLGTTSTRFQDLFLSGGVAAQGNSTFTGSVTVGGLISTGSASIRTTYPAADSQYDLGSNSFKWANIYADNFRGNLNGDLTGNLVTSSTLAKEIVPDANNTHDLGDPSYKWANVYASTLSGDLSGNLVRSYTYTQNVAPNLNNTYDLGTSSARWADIYAQNTDSNTASIQTLTSTNITTSNVTASSAVNVSNQLKFTEGASDWTFEVDASNNLIIKYGTTTVLELTTAGALSVKDDITAFDSTL